MPIYEIVVLGCARELRSGIVVVIDTRVGYWVVLVLEGRLYMVRIMVSVLVV